MKLQKIPPKLLSDVLQACLENSIGLYFVNKPYLGTTRNRFSGYFDDRKIVVATKDKEWLDVLLHESCHLDQFSEQHPLWDAVDKAIGLVEEWVEGAEISNGRIKRAIQTIISLEHDCEKRTLKKIDYYKLPICKKHYATQANAYLFGYWATYKRRVHCLLPYQKPAILKLMPKRLLPLDSYLNPDKKFISSF